MCETFLKRDVNVANRVCGTPFSPSCKILEVLRYNRAQLPENPNPESCYKNKKSWVETVPASVLSVIKIIEGAYIFSKHQQPRWASVSISCNWM